MDWLSRLKQTTETPLAKFPETIKREASVFHGSVEIKTPEGERLWVATESEAVKLIPSGAVFFLADEMMQLQKVGKEMARAALMVKQVFGSEARITATEKS